MVLQGIPIVSLVHFLYLIEYLFLDIVTVSRQRDVARWTNVGGPIPVGGRPIYSSSEVPISRISTEFLVKRIRQIANSPPDPYSEGSEEVEVVHNSIGHQSSTSPSYPPAKIFQSHIIPSTPRTFQPTLATFPHFSSSCFTNFFHRQACPGSRSKTIPHPPVHKFPHSHLSTTPTFFQIQQKKRGTFSFAVYCHPRVS
ncbi:hypothetical protein O181_010179 [Austropuccinia psidii MF-1]|uniref:Uncharacterized protein n=1 Tax=Austropuccinia psidii MF-1 TaxID=1389203 RepID=A0A9Q3BS40_9BASI|nr:hypothetical protein [Austropuccinia psidii MF-1]